MKRRPDDEIAPVDARNGKNNLLVPIVGYAPRIARVCVAALKFPMRAAATNRLKPIESSHFRAMRPGRAR